MALENTNAFGQPSQSAAVPGQSPSPAQAQPAPSSTPAPVSTPPQAASAQTAKATGKEPAPDGAEEALLDALLKKGELERTKTVKVAENTYMRVYAKKVQVQFPSPVPTATPNPAAVKAPAPAGYQAPAATSPTTPKAPAADNSGTHMAYTTI